MTGLLKSIPNNTFFYIKLAYCVQVSHKEQIKIIDPGLIIEISTVFLIPTNIRDTEQLFQVTIALVKKSSSVL
jgi:hypothetical protein